MGKIINFFKVRWFQSKASKKVTSTQEEVQKYCNWKKELSLRL